MRAWLERVLLAWIIWAVAGIYLFIHDAQPDLIPEPLNTLLFLGTGILLIIILVFPSIRLAYRKRQLILQSRAIEDLYLLSPGQFENLIAVYFEQYGYVVKRVGRTRDHGVDLRVNTRNGEIWIVQCKRWKGSIGEPIVRDLFGTMHHESAGRAFLMTTGAITPAAYAWAQDKPIMLYDGAGLIRLLRRVQRSMD